MLDANQVTIKDLKISGPLAGKKLEIQFDLKPIEEKKDQDKDKDKEKYKKKEQNNKSSDGGGLGLLFFLLFALIFMVGQTAGFSSLTYSETQAPNSSQYRYQPAIR